MIKIGDKVINKSRPGVKGTVTDIVNDKVCSVDWASGPPRNVYIDQLTIIDTVKLTEKQQENPNTMDFIIAMDKDGIDHALLNQMDVETIEDEELKKLALSAQTLLYAIENRVNQLKEELGYEL